MRSGIEDPPPVCPRDLEHETANRLPFERQHIQMVLGGLIKVAEQLRSISAPATILLISGGLGFDQQSYSRFEQTQTALKEAGVAVYAVQVDPREAQTSDSRLMHGSFTPRAIVRPDWRTWRRWWAAGFSQG